MYSAATPDAIIDRVAILDRLEGDVDLLREIVELFLEDCPNRIASLRAALAGRDSKALELAAHSIKGSVSNFVAGYAIAAAVAVEDMARAGDFTHAEAACLTLEQEITRLKPALDALR